MEPVEISVVLVLRDRADTAPTVLAHLEQQTLPAARFEIVAIDLDSQDDTAGVLARYADGAPVCIRVVCAGPRNFARARNLGAEQARGKWLVFLDQDLLASPNLLERYLQEFRAAPSAPWLLGAIRLHPQLPDFVLTRRLAEERWRPRTSGEGDVPPTAWQGDNLGMGRVALLNRGGFDETFELPHHLEVALAHQLARDGEFGRELPRAYAYEWKAATLDEERLRSYERGYGLRHLECRIGEEAAQDLHPRTRGLRWQVHRLMMPFYLRASANATNDLRYAARLYRRVLDHEVQRGYNDARRGRPARP